MIQEIKLSDYINEYGEHWADEMPPNCPPEDVCVSHGDVFYRMTRNEDRIVPEDWLNYLTLFPHKKYSAGGLILAAGLSLVNSRDAAEKKMKLPYIKRQGFKGLATISIIQEDGVVLQTTNDTSHYTWWRTSMCDLAKTEIV